MRCVNCGRMASADDSQCPYCGCPVLSAVDVDAEARRGLLRLWDEDPLPPPDNVVPLPVRPRARGPYWSDRLSEALVWGGVWYLAAHALGVVGAWGTWVAFGVALGADLALLTLTESRPWYRPPAREAKADAAAHRAA